MSRSSTPVNQTIKPRTEPPPAPARPVKKDRSQSPPPIQRKLVFPN